MISAIETAKQVIRYSSPLAGFLMDAAEKASKSVDAASNQGIDKLNEEVAKETVKMRFALQQARIAQELAIAKRIENAEEVEIEEFYDTAGKVNAGINVDQNASTASLGIGAEGRYVVKRIYHFKGGNTIGTEAIIVDAE